MEQRQGGPSRPGWARLGNKMQSISQLSACLRCPLVRPNANVKTRSMKGQPTVDHVLEVGLSPGGGEGGRHAHARRLRRDGACETCEHSMARRGQQLQAQHVRYEDERGLQLACHKQAADLPPNQGLRPAPLLGEAGTQSVAAPSCCRSSGKTQVQATTTCQSQFQPALYRKRAAPSCCRAAAARRPRPEW